MSKNFSHIFLTGFMGSGKTTVGSVLAETLSLPFIDTDELIERKAGKTVTAIFSDHGEDYFRGLENVILRDCLAGPGAVVSLGGGTLKNSDNRSLIQRNGILIYLHAEPETIRQRVKDSDSRPLLLDDAGIPLPDGRAVERIAELLAERYDGYTSAGLTVITDNREVATIVKEITGYITRLNNEP